MNDLEREVQEVLWLLRVSKKAELDDKAKIKELELRVDQQAFKIREFEREVKDLVWQLRVGKMSEIEYKAKIKKFEAETI